MIERLSHLLAIRIKNANPDQTASIDIMKFSIIGIINNSITFVLILLIGSVGGHLYQTCIALLAFMVLRIFAGGFHFNSPITCIVVSTVTISVIPYLSSLLNTPLIILFNLISVIITLVYAPSNIKKTRISQSRCKIYKAIAVLLVSSNFLFLSPSISLSFLIQNISIIERKEGMK